MSYVELHARSAFSFHRGASPPERIAERAAELNLSQIALCDRDGVYGSARLHQASREQGLRAIVGSEVTLEDGSVLPLLVRSRTGYRNLCRMLTRAKLRAPKNESATLWSELEEFSEGLVALTGDEEGPVRQPLEQGDLGAAEAAARRLVAIYGRDGVHVELQRHRIRGENWTINHLADLAESLRLPIIVTTGACFATPADRPLHDAFTCLRHHTTLDEAGRLLARNAKRHLKSPEQMQALFADRPEALANTLRLAERLEFTLENLGYEFPDHPVSAGETPASVLRREAYRGARRRYGKITGKIRAQLDHELDLITRLGFCGYFLIVWDIVKFARSEGILVQGRGSAANSAVCYCLGITAADPIGGKLLFERFLSEGRNSWPDIDLDLPSGDGREAVIKEIYRRYAPTGAAMTANVITYRGRSAIREMGKVLGLPSDVLGRFSDLYGRGDFPHTLELQEQLSRAGMPARHPRAPALIALYQAVYGLPRHLGQHSGGMIISDKGLDRIVPLEPASMEGRVVVQWDKDDCEDLGIIKVDLLGLGMLAAVEEVLELCDAGVAGPNREVDLARIPKDDPATYAMLQKADTIGVFQVESRAQMATLPRMKPTCFYDIVIETAIIRPGPIVGNLVHPYLNRRAGKEPIDYIDDRLRPVLERTLGVPLFQEQVLKIAMVIADFTGSEAEELRRALSFHRSEERMNKVMLKLRTAMTRNNVAPATQDRIVGSIKSFALYGFPESHAISFALIAYASAWLKVHRTVEFYVALLNNQPMGFYSRATLVRDAKRHGIRVRPVSVIDSELVCTVESEKSLRLGLHQLRGLSRTGARRIASERALRPWESLDDFLSRTSLNIAERRLLAKAGALNGLAQHRRDALWRVETIPDPDDLFSRIPNSEFRIQNSASPPASPLAPMTPGERLRADYEATHLTTGPHPMAYIRASLPGIPPASELATRKHGDHLAIAGLVICRQRPGTAKGHMFISLEDESGISNAFVPSTTFEKYRLAITQEPFLIIHGTLQVVDGVTSVYTQRVEALPFGSALDTKSHDFH